MKFETKANARGWAWDRLQAEKLARFPFPPHGRIPNFVGADLAAARLFEEPEWRDARAIKVNPDSPQREVRRRALELGIRVYVPTPRLAGGFHLLDPEAIDSTGLTAVEWTAPSPDGGLFAFGTHRSGDENTVLQLLDVDSGEWLDDEIPGKVDLMRWLPDHSGFYYARLTFEF